MNLKLVNFTLNEFACTCCDQVHMDEKFLAKLDEARTTAGIPFVITSGYRCPKHNAEIGSSSNNHTSGHAADIISQNDQARGRIVVALIQVGFKRIGISKIFVHVDDYADTTAIWLY